MRLSPEELGVTHGEGCLAGAGRVNAFAMRRCSSVGRTASNTLKLESD